MRPDIFLIEAGADIPDDVYRGVPLWIAEIADPSSAAQDYVDKAQLYHYHGVREYWVINDWKRQVMVIRGGEDKDLPGGADMKKAVPEQAGTAADGRYPAENETLLYKYKDSIPLQILPGFSISMDDILH